MAALDRRRDRIVAHARMDAEWQPAPIGQPGIGRERVLQRRVRGDATWIVACDDAEPDEVLTHLDQGRIELVGGRGWDVDRHETRGRLVQHAFRRPAARPTFGDPPDDATRGVTTRQVGLTKRRMAGPQCVVIVRPERRPAARCNSLEGIGRRPATPTVGVPAMALEPGALGQPLVRRAKSSESLVERRCIAQIDVPRCESRLRQMQMRVGQPGDRDLIGVEPDALRERVGAGLEVDLGPGERDPPAADADRLDPAETAIAGERRDATGDEHVQRHGRSAYRVGQKRRERVPTEAGAEPEGQRHTRLDRAQRAGRDRARAHPRRTAARERVGRRDRARRAS